MTMPAFVVVRILVPFRPAVWGVMDTRSHEVVEFNEFWKQKTAEDRARELTIEEQS